MTKPQPMNAATIAQLIIILGPTALELIPKLAAVWTKPDLTPEEVRELCEPAKRSYDAGLAETRQRLAALGMLPA
jgi:hypothetical protein